jgi:rhodanese-related sulfurtransferase
MLREIYTFFSLLVTTYFPALGQDTFDETLESIYSYSVPLIKPEELKGLQSESDTVLIIDTRSWQEFEVSHLQNAYFVDYEKFDQIAFEQKDKSIPVVLYCSVGYRSEKIGEKFQQMGFQKVYNLYGGIFQWKNLGFPLVNQQGELTDSVHTYNKNWAKWLKKGVKVY